jgi:hypothetical protein
MAMTPYLKKLFATEPGLEACWREQLKEHPMLGQTTWTATQIEVLDKAHDDHHMSCEECTKGIAVDCPEPESHDECLENPDHACYLTGYCPTGKETFKAWLNASHEYSWQEDFPGQIV